MYKYKIYGIIFESDLELPECESAGDNCEAEIVIKNSELEEIEKVVNLLVDAKKKNIKPGEEMPSKYVKGTDGIYSSCIVDIGYFKISNANLIEYRSLVPANEALFHQWILAYATTIALIQRQEIILHGAGLLVPGTNNAFVVCGESGAGKSTISDALLNRGFLFVADDSVRVADYEGVTCVYGSNMQRRLCTDVIERESYEKDELDFLREGTKEKYLKNMGNEYFGNEPRLLTSIFILTKRDCENVEIEEIIGAGKINAIVSQLYKKDVYSDLREKEQILIKILKVASVVKAYRITRPIEGMTVQEVTDAIFSVVRE